MLISTAAFSATSNKPQINTMIRQTGRMYFSFCFTSRHCSQLLPRNNKKANGRPFNLQPNTDPKNSP